MDSLGNEICIRFSKGRSNLVYMIWAFASRCCGNYLMVRLLMCYNCHLFIGHDKLVVNNLMFIIHNMDIKHIIM